MGKPSALHGRLVPQVEASGDTSRSRRVDLPAKSGEPIEHGVEQRPKARATVEARENCARLLLENSEIYFVCGSFEKRVHTFFGCLHVKLESENVLTHGKRLLQKRPVRRDVGNLPATRAIGEQAVSFR